MDCHKALEFLDCIRPKSDDLELPEFAEARAHVESCESCQQEFASRQEFDAAIAAVVQEVAVPESLRAELLSSALVKAGESEESAESTSVTAASAHVPRRRILLLAAASVACSVAIGMTLWFWDSGQKSFSVADLLQRIDIQLDNADDFDESFVFQLPAGWSSDGLLLGQDLDGEAGHEVARLDFELTRGRREPVSGIIAAIPANRVVPPPSASSFSSAELRYLPDGVVAVVWSAGNLVYVVMISGKPSELEYLQRAFSRVAA